MLKLAKVRSSSLSPVDLVTHLAQVLDVPVVITEQNPRGENGAFALISVPAPP